MTVGASSIGVGSGVGDHRGWVVADFARRWEGFIFVGVEALAIQKDLPC